MLLVLVQVIAEVAMSVHLSGSVSFAIAIEVAISFNMEALMTAAFSIGGVFVPVMRTRKGEQASLTSECTLDVS